MSLVDKLQGKTLGGRFELRGVLGMGGYGVVFSGWDTKFDKVCAVKALQPQGEVAIEVARFKREARAIAGLRHQHVVQFYDFDYDQPHNTLYIAMELVDGAPLDVVLARRKRLPIASAAEIVAQAAMGIQAAHALGVIHRDVKPANLIICGDVVADPEVKIIDFGIAKFLDDTKLRRTTLKELTKAGTTVGTPVYMAPEQAAGKAVGPATDQYSLAICLYEMVSGRPPFTGDNPFTVAAAHLTAEPEPPSRHHDAVPAALDHAILRALSKDPDERFADLAGFGAAVRTACAGVASNATQDIDLGVAVRTIPAAKNPTPKFVPATVTDPVVGGFELGHQLGRGGMAVVWQSVEPFSHVPVAVKMMQSRAGGSIDLREAFLTEARAHASLDHPNVVKLLDYGRVGDDDVPPAEVEVGDPFQVMELAEASLRDDPLPTTWTELCAILQDVLRGLGYAHARGIVHRDLKPENILRIGTEQPLYKLSDFGIAYAAQQHRDTERALLTMTVGTPYYMAPEQFRAAWYDYGPHTDLYALGCIAYELVTGSVPFTNTRLIELATAHMSKPPAPLQPRFDVPAGFEDWVARLLAKAPRDRYPLAADARFALDAIGNEVQVVQGTAAPAAVAKIPQVDLDGATTLVDAMTELVCGETLDAIVVPGVDTTDDQLWTRDVDTQPAHKAIPSCPATWRTPVATAGRALGLGLFALRETPMVGFEQERDKLWGALRAASIRAKERPRVVVVRGTRYAPVNRILRWLSRRAIELGVAFAHTIEHSRAGGPREGLPTLLEDVFDTWAMQDAEVRDRVFKLVARAVEEADSCTALLTDVILRARGNAETLSRPAPSVAETTRAATAFLAAHAPQRPYLVCVADAQWSRDAWPLAARIRAQPGAGLVVVGVREHEVDPQRARRLDELEAAGALVLRMQDPQAGEAAAIATAMLPLTQQAAAGIVEATAGDARSMHLLIDGLRRDDALIPGPDGFAIRDEDQIPATPAEIFARAVARFGAANPPLRQAVEVAAALGRAPDPVELTEVCAILGVDSSGLAEPLTELGLAEVRGARWWFAHDGIVRVIRGASAAAGRNRALHKTIADVLMKRVGADDPATLDRAARHFVESGSLRDAFAPWFLAMRVLLSSDTDAAAAILHDHDAACELLDLADDDPPRIDADVIRMSLARAGGDDTGSVELGTSVVQRAERTGHHVAAAFALRHLGRVARSRRDFETAIDYFRRAETISRDADDPRERAAAAIGLGDLYDRVGDHEQAVSWLTTAVELNRQAGIAAAEARASCFLASVLANLGDLDAARKWASMALTVAERASSSAVAEASNVAGDLARLAGDYDEARDRYADARQRFAFGIEVNVDIVDLNVALLDVAQRRWARAESELRRLESRLCGAGLGADPLVELGLAACHAARSQNAEADQARDRLAQEGQQSPDADVRWLSGTLLA